MTSHSNTSSTTVEQVGAVTPKPDLEAQLEKEATANSERSRLQFPVTDLDAGIVGWDRQEDPKNPQNYTQRKKWTILALISAMTIISPLASSMFAPAVEYMAREFHETNATVISLSVSIYLLGYTVGPLLLAPLSEIYGRRIILSAGNWFFVVWQIGCALAPNIETLIVCRLFAGIGGSACLTLGAGVIADLFSVQQRGKATALWAMGPLIGPVAGPIAGGFLGEAAGWRWVFWLLLIAGGALSLFVDVVNQETYAPVLLRRKAAALSKELGRDDLRSALGSSNKDISVADTIRKAMLRPFLLLSRSVIVLLLSVYMSLVYGLLYLFFTTITSVMTTQYGFSTGLAGLAYLGIGIGFLVGLLIIGLTNDKMAIKLANRNGGKHEPEMRLPIMAFSACILPISFFWYGWTAEKHVHWIVPIIGMFPFGVGMMGVFMPIQTYVIDCYPAYAASGNAALTATRSLLGALLPLAGPAMFKSLGLGWGNSLLGFLALAFVPLPLVFIRYGKVIRERWPVTFD
ncbi:Major facilitator superfamily domain, general substrate transporter [Akanthomyces lecanii RCEF 1005]|uniref:Major facilitator superfamily domain, general substrate transporter n=1 Tax=Akanthomyces lecanii RCEF 1005 TaxID=1081108 RepID=A0A168L191_CORDF|nr:Major facilitator superfamily domain, general substrate transporter [Akanthomyces lecanii RCEF 1005]